MPKPDQVLRNKQCTKDLGGLILLELDRFGRALVDACPAFNAVFWACRVGSNAFHLIDVTRADLAAVSAAIASFRVYRRIHASTSRNFKAELRGAVRIPSRKKAVAHLLYRIDNRCSQVPFRFFRRLNGFNTLYFRNLLLQRPLDTHFQSHL